MAESASPHSQTATSPLTGPSSLGSAADPQGSQTVRELPHYKAKYNDNGSLDNRLHLTRRPSGGSRDGSPESSLGQSYSEKQLEASPRRLRHIGSTQAAREAWQRSGPPSGMVRNGSSRDTRLDMPKPASSKKEKKGGFRNTLRRMFGRRSPRDRISMPAPTVYPRHNPEEFITSATEFKTKRSASVPTNGLLRTSGLTSHPPPHKHSSAARAASTPVPPQPERRPPERPARPRSASVPSVLMSRHSVETPDAAVTGTSLENAQEQNVDAQNIGFAVTNGSNPKRRSKSVGAFRDTEHRMSPIQWRKFRRRSDEIKYWRQSTDLGSLGIKTSDSPEIAQKDDAATKKDDEPDLGGHSRDFNFGLPTGDPMPNQEPIGLEERIVTLEIKLMDFEYAISKLQAGSTSPSWQYSHEIKMTQPQDSLCSNLSSNQPQASIEPSALPPEKPPMTSSHFIHSTSTPKPRPTSVATTLKPGTSPRKGSIDRSSRSSLTGLTIEHYTTLITLIRHEQSARVQLEQQVAMLQQRLDYISPLHSMPSHAHSLSQHSHSRSLSSQQRRQGFVDTGRRGGAHFRQQRGRSSSYSTTETDTDDDAYHDVYVTPDITPVERGEYERVGPGEEEGVAF